MSTKKKEKKEKKEKPVFERGMVLYTDGGCRPGGRGIGGWGYHGYSFEIKPVKPTKKENAITTRGYANISLADGKFDEEGFWSQPFPQKDFDTTITAAETYFDGWGSVVPESTNNISELLAFQQALGVVELEKPKEANFWLDSEYVLKGVTQWHEKWEANNWMSAAGKPVANADLWKSIIEDYRRVSENVTIRMDWVKGHNDNLGNDTADRNATRGVILGKNLMPSGPTSSLVGGDIPTNKQVHEKSEARSYWNKKNPYNRLLAFPSWYFVVNQPSPISKDGRTLYHIGTHGTSISQCGKRVSDQGYAVVALKEPEQVLEEVRDYQNTDCSHSYERVVVADISKILLPDNYDAISKYGGDYFTRWTHLNDVYNEHEDRLTEELVTPLLVFRKIEELSALTDRLEKFISGDHQWVLTDITDLFYETTTKGKKEVTSLKKTIKQSDKSVVVGANCDLTDASATTDITLNIGFDLPNRNALNAVAEGSPKLTLLLERESERSYRYWTVIEVGDDIAIWSSIYANQKILLD